MQNYLEVLQKAGQTPWSIGRCKAATLFNTDESRARRILDKLRKNQNEAAASWTPTDLPLNKLIQSPSVTEEFVGNKWNLTINGTRIKTLEELVKDRQIDLKAWEVQSFKIKSWEMMNVPRSTRENQEDKWVRPSSEPSVTPLYAVSAVFVKAKGLNIEWVKGEIETLKSEAKKVIKAPAYIKSKQLRSGISLELSCYDAHIGRLSWGEETGWENYDLNISISDYDKAVDTILSRNSLPLEEICYVVGNDLIHFDNQQGTTTKGTALDVDGRFQKVFLKARKTVQKQIEKLRAIAPVKVFVVPGNHDNLSTWHLGDSLECVYENSSDVTIYNRPTPRKYYQYGSNMVMFCHGDKGKIKNYPMIMAAEQPVMWASSVFREVHIGHFHHQIKDDHGTITRIIPALCPADFYHSSNGFVGAMRGAQAFQWHREEGLIGTIEYSIKPETN